MTTRPLADQVQHRMGLYGGAFDPPHRAHVDLARCFIEQAALGRLYICPTAGAWHKRRGLSSAEHRVRMCELAFAGVAGVQIDTQEIERGGNSYTVDTLEALHQRHPHAELALLIGQDQFERLGTWHALDRICVLARIHVAQRSEGDATIAHDSAQRFAQRVREAGFEPLAWTPRDDSATVVRERRHAGQPIDDLVTPAVARYIADHHLYL